MHLCFYCQQKEHMNHLTIDLEKFIEENKNKLKKTISSNSIISKINQFLDHIQEAIDQSRILIKNNIESNKDIYSFNDSLFRTYECIKDIPNYHSINNILNNDITILLKDSCFQLLNDIQSYFTNSLNQLNQLKNELNQLQSYSLNVNDVIPSFITDPKKLSIQRTISNNTAPLGTDQLAIYTLDDKNYELAYPTYKPDNNIEIMELNNYSIKFIIKEAHSDGIKTVKYYYDHYKKIHYLISVSLDESIKLWDIKQNYKNILTIANAASRYRFITPLFMLFSNKDTLIGAAKNTSEKIKIYDMTGKSIYTINSDYEYNWHSETYDINNNIYILISGKPGITVYDYNNNKTKFKLISNNDTYALHGYSKIEKINNNLIIFDSDNRGYITLWNFNSGEMIKIIQPEESDNKYSKWIYSLCVWNDNYLLSGRVEGRLKLYDLNSCKLIHSYDAHSGFLMKISKFKFKDGNEFLLTSSCADSGGGFTGDHKLLLWY